MLMDVAFLNEIAGGIPGFLGKKLGRELPGIDLPAWLSYLALDAGLRGGQNEIQVLLVHDEATRGLKNCEPSALTALDGMACRTPVGEFSFSCVTPAGMASCEELYLDLMNLTLDSADVKCLMLVPFHPLYAGAVEDGLRKFSKEKGGEACGKAVYFMLNQPSQPVPARCEPINYSLLQALGVKPDELK